MDHETLRKLWITVMGVVQDLGPTSAAREWLLLLACLAVGLVGWWLLLRVERQNWQDDVKQAREALVQEAKWDLLKAANNFSEELWEPEWLAEVRSVQNSQDLEVVIQDLALPKLPYPAECPSMFERYTYGGLEDLATTAYEEGRLSDQRLEAIQKEMARSNKKAAEITRRDGPSWLYDDEFYSGPIINDWCKLGEDVAATARKIEFELVRAKNPEWLVRWPYPQANQVSLSIGPYSLRGALLGVALYVSVMLLRSFFWALRYVFFSKE